MSNVYIDTGRTSITKKHDDVVPEQSFAQVYRGAFKMFAQLNTPCSKNLLIWMVGKMDRWNRVILNKAGRQSFIGDSVISGGRKYSDSSVRHSIQEILSIGAAVSMSDEKSRESLYMVNPHFFWKTKTQRDRLEAIKGYIYKLKENEGN
jgi:hypothetical protein